MRFRNTCAAARASIGSRPIPPAIPETGDAPAWTQGEAWAPVEAGDGRFLLYGPRFGRSYLSGAGEAGDAAWLAMLGLSRAVRCGALLDPARRIDKTLAADVSPKAGRPSGARRHAAAYRALRLSRHVLSLRACARLLRRLAIIRGRNSAPACLGDAVHAAERRAGGGDCYPRALLTAYLALRAGRPCVLAVGALAPTRKMHVWCVVDGAIPYEPSPEHYLYQPLWTLDLTP